jgi:hypothetical protein
MKALPLSVEWRGELPALQSGLIDPEDPRHGGRSAFEADEKNKIIIKDVWPKWRKVEICVDGKALIVAYDGR